MLDGADLGTLRQRALSDVHVVVLQDGALGPFEARHRDVVLGDGLVFLDLGGGQAARSLAGPGWYPAH